LKSIALNLDFLGTVLLCLSLIPTRQLCTGKHQNTRAWRFLGALIILFLLGYAAYGLYLFKAEVGRLDLFVALILFGGGIFVLSVVFLTRNSIDQLTRMAASARHRSLHDELTELPNRNHLHELIDLAVIQARESGEQFTILLIDLNRL